MHMTNRTTKIASAILLGAIIGGFLAVDAAPLQAADECLSRPKGVAPAGSHWYYRVDRAAKRNCWYMAAEGRQTKSAKSLATPASPRTEASLQPSVANARAEAAPADIALSSGAAAESARFAMPANKQDANLQAADNVQGAVASRWLDQESPSAIKTPAPQSNAPSANPSSPAPLPPVAAAAAPTPAVTPDRRSPSAQTGIPRLFFVIIGALAAAAIFGCIIFKYASRVRKSRHNVRLDQRAPWDSIDFGATIKSPPLATATETQRGFAREYQKPAIPDEIVQLLSKLSKEAVA
jgi:hypothetical protein